LHILKAFVTQTVYVARIPAEFDRFASIDELYIVFGDFEYEIQFGEVFPANARV